MQSVVRPLRFVSLFAGVGGFDLGLERAGHECVGQVEIDAKARSVLQRHWPDVPKHDDVTTAKEWADARGLVGNVDLVCGGFPCQDLSVAGKRAGLAGERSGLFFDALAFAAHVKAPRIILENVVGLLSSNNGRDFGVLITELANAGYRNIEWRVLDSQFFGVPQRRRRIFIIANAGNASVRPVLAEREGSLGDFAQIGAKGEATSPSTAPSARGSGVAVFSKSRRARSPLDFETWVANGISPTLNLFDNSTESRATVVIAEPDPTVQRAGWLSNTNAVGTVSSKWAKGTGGPAGDEHYNLVAVGEPPTVVRRLTPIECERLQGFPDGWTAEQADSNRYKQMGNAVTVNVIEWIGKRL